MHEFNRRKALLAALTLGSLPLVSRGGVSASKKAADSNRARQPVTTMRSEQFRLKSDAGREYVIQVGLPHEVDPDLRLMLRGRKPATLYVLDGDSSFGLVSDMTRMMQWGGDVPPCLVVGITYPSELLERPISEGKEPRHFDLTPTHNAGLPDFSGAADDTGGGLPSLNSLKAS